MLKKYVVKITFLEELLGTVAKDEEIYSNFIASKAPDDVETGDEIETVPDPEIGVTGFHRLDDGTPILYDYVIKGFMKDACGMLRRDSDTLSKKLTAYKKVIDGMVFPFPRRIKITLPEGEELGRLERPLRAQTARGERIALACSETVPVGSSIEFTIKTMGKDASLAILKEWFDYGIFRGLGQWRNGGYGRFEYEIKEVE